MGSPLHICTGWSLGEWPNKEEPCQILHVLAIIFVLIIFRLSIGAYSIAIQTNIQARRSDASNERDLNQVELIKKIVQYINVCRQTI